MSARRLPSRVRRGVWFLALALLCAGCAREQATPAATAIAAPDEPRAANVQPAVVAQPTVVVQPTANVPPEATSDGEEPPEASLRELTVFYTNDEHGWMEGTEPGLGAANLMGLWREAGYEEDGPYLVLSGGDMWTGPAISTWFEGQSMAEVLNGMGYAAAAVGNHEFDFGLEALRARSLQSDFPFVSANVRDASGATPQEWGIEPYVVIERNGIQVGIVGLTTTSTPVTTNPNNLRDLQFLDYEDALREIVPQARADGAELLLVAGHLCRSELETLAHNVGDLDLHFMGGGHCNELFTQTIAGTVLVGGGYHLTSYARVDFLFDTDSDKVLQASAETARNTPAAAPDEDVSAIVGRWQARAAEELDVVIGYSERGLPRRSDRMLALVTESWLWAYPTADVAITNSGGFRAALPPGEITFADVVGVLPFNNVLVEVELSGEQLLQVLAQGSAVAGGAQPGAGEWILRRTGQPIRPEETYHVLVNDFMYAGGDDYGMLAQFDPQSYNTAIDWRQPVIDWILAQASSPAAPLDEAFAGLAR